ncbi:putative gustatory receptor 98a [Drosophila sulfurigaster albostrigata]|uniref:putative gustatory receptor 98a n=1 Tax=Drosophila sulfurigaster albostrigata TaxID=89887 RepID=UPI002D21EDFD|nr:putative gustatory receptor 98a [Drosophila sulfurigaster albostrigata]
MELQDCSLRLMRHFMCCILLLPPRPQLHLKLFYSLSILTYLIIITHWRFGFEYEVNYDYMNDYFSRAVDLFNFVALISGHVTVALELIWRNRSVVIDQKFQELQNTLHEKLGHKVNVKRIQLHCNLVFSFLFLRVIVLTIMTLMNFTTTSTYFLYVLNFYSEMVEILRCCEFILHGVLVLSIYQELNYASYQLVLELQTKNNLCVERIFVMQELHQLLWRTQREIEKNFELSIIVIMMKNFVDTSVIPYWMYVSRNFDNFALHSCE